jgi:hypothetical protein
LLGAAVVGGVAYSVGSSKGREQAEEAQAAQQPLPTPPASKPPTEAGDTGLTDKKIAQLKQLSELREAGVLTDEEFEKEKQKLLAG